MKKRTSDDQLVSKATVNIMRTLTKEYLPPSEQKKFLIWLLEDSNPYQDDYLQISGIKKMNQLAEHMLFISFKDEVPSEIFEYIGALHAYFVFEVISDNLGMRLAFGSQSDSLLQSQKEILIGFNTAMQRKLLGDPESTSKLLEPYLTDINKISSHHQCLTSLKMQNLVEQYHIENPHAPIHELEYSIYHYLTLNIISCLKLVDLLKDHALLSPLIQSLRHRYQSMNNFLLFDDKQNLSKLAQEGSKTILVVPTLLYIIGALDKVQNNRLLPKNVDNKLLINTLNDAAFLIRLQNDLGTKFLKCHHEDFQVLTDKMSDNYLSSFKKTNKSSFANLNIIIKSQEYSDYFSRIRKDFLYGEFNICLQNLLYIPNNKKMIKQFFENINFFRNQYERKNEALLYKLEKLKKMYSDELISHLILSMVNFHEMLYENDYENKQGEYAIN